MALAAADALIIIDLCAEILDLDRVIFAGLHALHAAYAARDASLASDRALVLVRAKHGRFCLMERHEIYKMLRAGLDASSARAAGKRIDPCHAVADMYRVIGAGFDTVSEAQAAVGAFLRPAEDLSGHFTALDAGINKLVAGIVIVALAKHHRRHREHLSRRKSGDLGDLFGDLGAAGGAEGRAVRFAL